MRREWLTWFLLLVLMIVGVKACSVQAQEQPIAYCNDEGQCVIAREMLGKLMNAVVFWHEKAKKCEAI